MPTSPSKPAESAGKPEVPLDASASPVVSRLEDMRRMFALFERRSIPTIQILKQVLVERALAVCDGNVTKAGYLVGISRANMYRLLKQFGIKVGHYKHEG